MSITPLSAARIAGEVGLAGGTITGGAYAAKYSGQVNVVKEKITADKGKLRTAAHDMSNQIDLINTAGFGQQDCEKDTNCIGQSMVHYKQGLESAINGAYQARQKYLEVSGNV